MRQATYLIRPLRAYMNCFNSWKFQFLASAPPLGNSIFSDTFQKTCVQFTQKQRYGGESSIAAKSTDAEIEAINLLFAESREEIEMATEDAGTVYFNESADEAQKLVKETISRWNKLLETLPSEERDRLMRSMGMKMEQLKAELAQLDRLHDDD